jgi:hypothetical protein
VPPKEHLTPPDSKTAWEERVPLKNATARSGFPGRREGGKGNEAQGGKRRREMERGEEVGWRWREREEEEGGSEGEGSDFSASGALVGTTTREEPLPGWTGRYFD